MSGVHHVIALENVLFGDVWLCSGHDILYDNINRVGDLLSLATNHSARGGHVLIVDVCDVLCLLFVVVENRLT